jgi:phage shock protein PspC (stress-responsive transcriptional regulator)
MERRLYRSRSDRMIWGVCGGLAKYFGIDPVIVRIIFVLLAFADGIGIIAYIVLAIVVRLEDSPSTTTSETVRENIEEMKTTATELGRELRTTFEKDESGKEEKPVYHRGRYIWGIVLVIIGAVFLLSNFHWLWWFHWSYLWPIILIAIGLIIIFSRRRRE